MKQHAGMAPLAAAVPKTRGKSRNKNHKPDSEQLRDEIRTLKSTIRHLKKLIAQYQKNDSRLEELEMIAEESNEVAIPHDGCPNCFKGSMNIVELGPRSMLSCNMCNYWKVLK